MSFAPLELEPVRDASPPRAPGRCECTGAGPCPACDSRKRAGLQAKSRVAAGETGDAFEQEADRAADAFMSGARVRVTAGSVPSLQRQGGEHAGAGTDAARAATDPARQPEISDVIDRPGRTLDADVRRRFEAQFGHDFSRVRIHDDAHAQASADALQAHAYTVGHDLVFGAGQHAPRSASGLRLLAHELAHVVQQGTGAMRLQRQEKKGDAKPAAKTDVSIVLTDDEKDNAEGGAYARMVLRVTSIDNAKEKLKALGVPIGTLFVISHSNSAGQLQFVDGTGGSNMKPAEDLAKALKGEVSIDNVDFRGCKLGDAAGTIETFRDTVGARSAKATNCWSFVQRATPLTLSGVPVTQQSQIPPDMQAEFDTALLNQLTQLQTDDGKPVRNCLIGLAPGETAGRATLAKIWKMYWANQGRLVASWASPEYNRDWQDGSRCTRDLTASSKPCGLIEAKAPAPAPTSPKKTSDAAPDTGGIELEDAQREALA